MPTATGSSALVPFRRQRITVFGAAVAFMLFYMIAFPKGGIKVSGIPLTLGYALTPLLALLAMMRGRGLAIPVDRLIALLPCVALGLWSLFVMHINGNEAAGATISYLVAILYLPLFGLIVFSPLLLDDHRRLIERTFVWALRFIVAYGIFLFVFKQLTGRWIEIPYVTINVADAGQLDDKYIRRGIFFKLISTYNNGNIFGVCVATMAPLYLILENRKVMRIALYVALFLTLSRTVWLGMALVFVMRSLSHGVRPATILYMLVSAVIAITVLSFTVTAMGRDMSFLWDRNLGGRVKQFEVLSDIRLIPSEVFMGLPEIAYLGMIASFGIPGFLLFIAHLATPSIVLWLEDVPAISLSPASACMQGMTIYMAMACSDAAFGLIPVTMVFWMIAGLGFWYASHQAKLQGLARAPAG